MAVNIQVKNISFSYPAAPVFRDLSFQVQPGDFLGIVGPNGSGKSTLLKNLTTYLTPYEGVIYLDGERLSNYPLSKLARKQAVVSQENPVNFNFSVFDLVAMGRAPYQGRFSKLSSADLETIRMVMEDTNCWHLRQRKLFQLSGGERQRVILARALAQTPEVLLLDEPTTFLDVGYQKEFMDLVARLNREKNLTVIVVLHDLNLASEYCCDLLLLEAGAIADLGPPEKVLTAANLQRVYKTDLKVIENPITGTPLVVLYPGQGYGLEYASEGRSGVLGKGTEGVDVPGDENQVLHRASQHQTGLQGVKIHIIGGGGRATPLMQGLFRYGAQLTLGVVNLGDSDHKTAVEMGAFSIVCQPFSPIDDESLKRAKSIIQEVDAVVLAPVPFGRGNLNNLELLEMAAAVEKPVILYKVTPKTLSDYIEGWAKDRLKALESAAAPQGKLLLADSIDQIAEWLLRDQT